MPGGLAVAPAFALAFGAAIQKMGGIHEFAAAFQELNAVVAIGTGPAGVVFLGPLVGAIVSVAVGVSGYFAGNPFVEQGEHLASRQVAGRGDRRRRIGTFEKVQGGNAGISWDQE